MNRPTLEVADIVRNLGKQFVDLYENQLSYQQLKALRAIERCRTAELGGHADVCSSCDYKAISYNSCRDRHCPKCQSQARQRWLAARELELLNTNYFHVVFTLPHTLAPLVRTNASILYNLLFRTSAATMLEVAADPKHLGAQIGFFSILHTWGQNLMLHPHVHCIVPAGGFSPDYARWVLPRYSFFLPVRVLGRVFRGKFIAGLRSAHRQGLLRGTQSGACFPTGSFRAMLETLAQEDWVVYAKPAMGGAPQVLRYLGRYTHRVAISNHRLLAVDKEKVTFRWKDYAHGNKQRAMTVSPCEFLRRFVQHVLPRGFVRIRHFGFFVNRSRTKLLALARRLLASPPKERESSSHSVSGSDSWECPMCGKPMRIGPNLTAAQLRSQCSPQDTS